MSKVDQYVKDLELVAEHHETQAKNYRNLMRAIEDMSDDEVDYLRDRIDLDSKVNAAINHKRGIRYPS